MRIRALFLLIAVLCVSAQPLVGVDYHVEYNKPHSAIVRKTSSRARRLFYAAQSIAMCSMVLSAGYNLVFSNARAEAHRPYSQEEFAGFLAGVAFGLLGIETVHSKLYATYEENENVSYKLIPKTLGDRIECGLWGLGKFTCGALLLAATKYCSPYNAYQHVKNALTGNHIHGMPRNFLLSENLFRLSSAFVMGSNGVELGLSGLQQIRQAFSRKSDKNLNVTV